MSLSTSEFFNQLNDHEEYYTVMMYSESFIPLLKSDWFELASWSSRLKNESFKDDDVHKGLVKNLSKAKRELSEYEHKKNHS